MSISFRRKTSQDQSPAQSRRIDEPMPLQEEVEKRFEDLVKTMDLTAEGRKGLLSLTVDKKWIMIQSKTEPIRDPKEYLDKLKHVIDAGKDYKKARKRATEESFMISLRSLNTSLRTNGVPWVASFLSDKYNGLETLVQFVQYRYKVESEFIKQTPEIHKGRLMRSDGADNDLHICVLCVKAVMNTSLGFRAAVHHPEAILSLFEAMFFGTIKTIITVLELLAAVCLIRGGHEKVMDSVSKFRVLQGETYKFETLVGLFTEVGLENPEFATTCMTFFNVVVHSTEDLNYRVYLQHEFSVLKMDDTLEKLEMNAREYPKFYEQMRAYQENYFNVGILLEDARNQGDIYKQAKLLERKLKELQDTHKKTEYQSIKKIADLERKVYDLKKYIKTLHETIPGDLPPMPSDDSRPVSCELPTWVAKDLNIKIKPMMLVPALRWSQLSQASVGTPDKPTLGDLTVQTGSVNTTANLPNVPQPPPLPGDLATQPPSTPIPAPPPAPLPPSGGAGPPPPPIPGVPSDMANLISTLPIKQKYNPKYRLPQMNWTALPASKVQNTVFSSLDESNVVKALGDMDAFEQMFKTKTQDKNPGKDNKDKESKAKETKKASPKEKVLDPNRVRNIAISLHKIKKPVEELTKGIDAMDTKALSQEEIEILQKLTPSPEETAKFEKYVAKKKGMKGLSPEEKFVCQLGLVERVRVKLLVMSLMNTFTEDFNLISVQVDALLTASSGLLNSEGLRRVFEVILTLGNYMNSSRRGPVYGFKVQALENFLETKSTDRQTTLLNYVVTVMSERFPSEAHFYEDLLYLKEAGSVSVDQLAGDVTVLTDQFNSAVEELVLSQDNLTLRDFVLQTEAKIKDLKKHFHVAEETYLKAVTFFGEDPKTVQPGPFFNEFLRFNNAYKKCELKNEAKKKMESAEAMKPPQSGEQPIHDKKAGKTVPMVPKEQLVESAEEGTIDKIIDDLANKPFIAKQTVKSNEMTDFSGVFENTPLAIDTDFSYHQDVLPSDRFSQGRPWLY